MFFRIFIAILVAVAVTPATASSSVTSDADFGQQNPSAAVLPLTVKMTASSPEVKFELWKLPFHTRERMPSSSFRASSKSQSNGLWEIELTVLQVPKLDATYSICATGRPSNATCPNGFLHSFYAFNPAFGRSLKVKSSGNTITARAAFSIRAPSPAGFRTAAAVQRYCHGSWRTVSRPLVATGPLASDNDWNAKVPVVTLKHTVANLQKQLRRGIRFRVVVDYRFYTGTKHDIVKADRVIEPVRHQ